MPRIPVQVQQGGDDDAPSGAAGKLRPFRTGLEGRDGGRTPPSAVVDFTLEDADLPDLVRMISRITGKRFILPGKARSIKATVASERPVTAAAAYAAFLSILQLNGMTIVPAGRYLKIVESAGAETNPLPLYTDGQATPSDDRYVTRMHRVQNVSAEDVATLLARFKSREGNITAYAPTNTIIITDTGTNIRRMLRILQEIDVPRTGEQIWIEPIHYANATELASRLQEIFPSAGGSGGSGGSGEQALAATQAATARARAAAARARAAQAAAGAGQPAAAAEGTAETVGASSGEARITNILPDERTNSLIILATERAYLRILEVIRALDIPVEGEGSIHVHPLQYADSEQMATTLQALITGRGGASSTKAAGGRPGAAAPAAAGASGSTSFEGQISVQAHKATNSLLITSSLHDYASLRRVIDRLDMSPRQVFIEAVIMELSVNRSSSLGLAFHGGVPSPDDGLSVFGFDAGRTATPTLSPDLLTGLAVGVRGPEIAEAAQLIGFSIPSFGVVLNAVANSGDVNVLSTPHIMAMDNVQAEITVGANVPLQTSGLAGLGGATSALAGLAGQSGQTSGASGLAGLAGLAGLSGGLGGLGGGVQRQNVGTTIRITPHINDAGEIRMEIEEEISEAGEAQGTLGVVPINQRIAKTQVVVRDQQTVVIGGLMRDRVTTSEDKIPILGDIPLLGVLFRRQSTTTQKTNLLLFLTPYVIRSPSDLRAIFERKLRERQEFIDRYFVFGDSGYTPATDYSRTRGLVSEILNTIVTIDEEQRLLEEMRTRPPPEHVPRPPVGSGPDSITGRGTIIIGPDGDEVPDDGGGDDITVQPGAETNITVQVQDE
ncbi:MAG: type II secretion system secretin GspD [Sandaracinaceae bacterium]|nr:type II secretion system secretin GspD [Sandaracinaceae bacterium]